MRSTVMTSRLRRLRDCLFIFLLATSPSFAQSDESGTAVTAGKEEMRARGHYLVTIAACNDCHTPWIDGPEGPEPDMTRMLSGHPQTELLPPAPVPNPADSPWIASISATNTAWAGPWGTSFTANLTPDPETGLGKWTLRNFVDTIRTGRHQGRGRVILPPMPILMYRNFTDEDLESIFTFLQSIPAISNKVPDPIIAGVDDTTGPSISAQ